MYNILIHYLTYTEPIQYTYILSKLYSIYTYIHLTYMLYTYTLSNLFAYTYILSNLGFYTIYLYAI